MSELQLYGAPASIYVWTTRMACAEKGAPYTLIPTMPHTPEVCAVHPFGKIPVMRHGGTALCESRAICGYVDRMFEGPPLIPREPAAAARVEQWISIIHTHVAPVLVLRYLAAYFFPQTPDGATDRATVEAAVPKMHAQFAVLDDAISPTGFLAGESFTLADIVLLPTLWYLKKLPESRVLLGATPHLQTYFERHAQRRSFVQTQPESIPDSFVRVFTAAQTG